MAAPRPRCAIRHSRLSAILLLAAGLLASCAEPAPETREPVRPERTLTIGLVPERNIFRQLARYERLASYLGRKTGVRIKVKVLPSYRGVVRHIKEAGADGAFLGSFTYLAAHEGLGFTPVARAVRPDGSSTYHGVIVMRRDSRIASFAQLRGRRFAFVGGTTAGYLLPLDAFRENGIGDYEKFFGETYFAGTHQAALEDVLEGRADAGAAKNTVLEELARLDPRFGEELVILARSPDVPENALALAPDVDPALVRDIKRLLLDMHQDPQGRNVLKGLGAASFVETTHADYAPVYAYAREAGLGLEAE